MKKNGVIKKDSIFADLKSKIISGVYPGGHKLPSEPVLAKELGVGRVTLRSALERLEKTGMVIRYPAKGTFVTDRNTSNNRKKKFLILIDNSASSLESPSNYILSSIERTCEQREIETELVLLSLIRALPEEHAIRMMKKSGYDGVILNTSYYTGSEKELTILRALDIPVIIPHARPQDQAVTGFATIQTDRKQAWIDGVHHLLESGHKRILSIGLKRADDSYSLRGFEKKEYLDFLAREGADPDPDFLHFIPVHYTGLTKLFSSLLSRPKAPTAIICFSFSYAQDIYDSLYSLSVKIPEQITIISCSVFPGAHLMYPPLSTIDFNYANIGAKAVDILDRANEWFYCENKSLPNIISPHKLIIRESSKFTLTEGG